MKQYIVDAFTSKVAGCLSSAVVYAGRRDRFVRACDAGLHVCYFPVL